MSSHGIRLRTGARASLVTLLLLLSLPQALLAQQAAPAAQTPETAPEPGAKVLTLADYPRWSRIDQVTLSPDGRWMTSAYEPNEGDSAFQVRDLEGDTVHTATNGQDPAFSNDSAWLAYFTVPAEDEAARLRRERQPVPRALHLLELAGAGRAEYADVASFAFAEDSRHLAVHRQRADREAEHSGADLILRRLDSNLTYNLGNVSEYAFNRTGTLLAYTIDAADPSGNGLYLMNLETSTMRPLDSGPYRYAQLTWNEGGTALAALRGTENDDTEQRDNALLTWLGVHDNGAETAVTYDPGIDAGFPAGMVVSELGSLSFSEDDSRVFLGIKEQRAKVKAPEGEDAANVDVWHWKDDDVQSVQQVRAGRDRRATWTSALLLEPLRFVRLADEDMPQVTATEDGLLAIGELDAPHRHDLTVEAGRADLYVIDTATGERALFAQAVRRTMGTSPDSRWFLYLKDGHVLARDLGSGATTDLSAETGIDFVDQSTDRPTEKPTYGVAGWSADGEAVLLNHEFDLYRVPLRGGAAVNLTAGVGAAEQIRFRLVQLDPEAKSVNTEQPMLLSAYGEWTKRSGFWRAAPGVAPEPLLWEDAMFGRPTKAKNADRVTFTRQTFVQFPDYWTTDLSFTSPARVTDANPQQAEYAWSPGRVLIDYVDERDNKLQATLTLPAGYVEGQRYPMLVYFYEKMSQRHHEYSMPVYDDRPHMSTYASDGYLVLMPDIVYDDGLPGSSALDDVTSAVKTVIDLGYADPALIGLQGHSWGGYESSFILTQTDMFAAIVTGAPLTNLPSMYNILYKSSGSPNGPILEWSQGRMNTNIWDDLDLYISQSPVHHADKINTPFVILHGTADGAVDWNQGLELYTAARRLGKEGILLSYPDEPHHLAKVANQKDFQIRMKQFFDHYLLGRPAPKWMTDGVRFLDKGREGPEGSQEHSESRPQ